MKYFLYTAQSIIGNLKGTITDVAGFPYGFFTQDEFNARVNSVHMQPAKTEWVILFLKELTKEEYEYYNK